LKHFIKNQRALTTRGAILALVSIMVVAVLAGAFMYGQGYFTPKTGTQVQTTPAPNQVVPGSWAGQLYASVVDKVTGASFTTATTTIQQVGASNGVFNFISGPQKELTQSANPQAEGYIWSQGQQVIVMVASSGAPTGGLAYYPVMYYMTLTQGAPIYQITSMAAFQSVSTSPATYTINTAGCTPISQTVQEYTAANVNYWFLGDLGIYGRTTAANLQMSLNHAGAVLASVTDGSTWINTASAVTANATLSSSTNDHLTLIVNQAAANIGWGQLFFVVDSNGVVHPYGATITVTTSCLTLQQPSGWSNFGLRTLTNEVGYYQVISPAFPSKGMMASWSVNIPFAVTPDSTKYIVKVWINDCQNLDNVGTQGLSASVPSGYGFVDSTTKYGVGAIVQLPIVTIAAGVSATPQLECYITTPSS
jgi:hypothetical protein